MNELSIRPAFGNGFWSDKELFRAPSPALKRVRRAALADAERVCEGAKMKPRDQFDTEKVFQNFGCADCAAAIRALRLQEGSKT